MAQDQKGACAKSAWLVFFDESGISLLPVTRRTWSPRGQTPILRHRCNWKRASMAAALGYHASDADRGPRLCFHVQKDSDNTQTLIGVLEQLAGFYLPEGFKDTAAYVVVLVVLLFMPSGIFGETFHKKV